MAIEGYDLVMLGILAAAAVLGYFKGVIWQIAWIAGIAASAIVALRFGGPLAPFFGNQAPWNRLVAMLALYVATSMAVWLVFGTISGIVKTVKLSSFDHQMGLLFGLAKGALLCIVVTFFAVMLAPGYRDQIVGSRSGRVVATLIVQSDQFLPPDVIATVKPFVDRFEDELRRPAGTSALPMTTAIESTWGGQATTPWTGGGQGATAAPTANPSASPQPSSWQPLPPSHPAAQPAQPGRPTSSGFSQQPAPPSPPGEFPVGAQSPIHMR